MLANTEGNHTSTHKHAAHSHHAAAPEAAAAASKTHNSGRHVLEAKMGMQQTQATHTSEPAKTSHSTAHHAAAPEAAVAASKTHKTG